jgi:lipid II:glycine glycyltransferase (peptidoglycan interpeptide bridge formation enzyme)
MVIIRKINQQKELDPYIEKLARSPLLQSWYWGEVLKKDGHSVDRISVMKGDRLMCVATMYTVEVPFGEYVSIPRGPIWFGVQSAEAWDELVKYIRGKFPEAIFIRVESEVEIDALKNQTVHETAPNQPRDEWAVELDKGEEDILVSMKQKTRYNIRLAQKKGVKVRKLEPGEVPAAFELLKETAKRQHITIHSKKHFISISDQPFATWMGAFFEGTLIAAHQLISFGDTVTYLHGGSSREHQKVMAPHFLHWREIQLAKHEGFQYFNFGGIAPHNADTHPLANITRFKKSFGGRALHYPTGYDIVLRAGKYRYFTLGKRIRRSALLNRLLP